jgi:membrane protein DedA with SNARE-associated domain
VSPFSHDVLVGFLHAYGYPALAILIALECLGLPLPGETLLIGAVLYAVRTRQIDIHLVVLAAGSGAFIGQLCGYLIGATLGYRLLRRYGSRIGLTTSRLALGRFLFRRHGVKVVVASRFVAVLRQIAGLLAGATRMPWPRFLAANAVGSVLWAAGYGFGAEALGATLKHVVGPLAIALGVIVAAGAVGGILFVRHHERRLTARTARARRPSAPAIGLGND